jgi:hypothetical protein
VVCMCDSRDTIILPCRHLCLCNACADSLRYQANNCPICRAPFRALLQVLQVFISDPGSEFLQSRIQYPNFFHPGSRIRIFSIPDPDPQQISIFYPKNCFSALRNMIRDVHPSSRIRILILSRTASLQASACKNNERPCKGLMRIS